MLLPAAVEPQMLRGLPQVTSRPHAAGGACSAAGAQLSFHSHLDRWLAQRQRALVQRLTQALQLVAGEGAQAAKRQERWLGQPIGALVCSQNGG